MLVLGKEIVVVPLCYRPLIPAIRSGFSGALAPIFGCKKPVKNQNTVFIVPKEQRFGVCRHDEFR